MRKRATFREVQVSKAFRRIIRHPDNAEVLSGICIKVDFNHYTDEYGTTCHPDNYKTMAVAVLTG